MSVPLISFVDTHLISILLNSQYSFSCLKLFDRTQQGQGQKFVSISPSKIHSQFERSSSRGEADRNLIMYDMAQPANRKTPPGIDAVCLSLHPTHLSERKVEDTV